MTFQQTLLHWYSNNARKLPWRETKLPYHIWVSEIILQQTRVEQGLPYYRRFIENLPNVSELHKSTDDQILKLWQGLGYYSRARNMKFAAKQIMEEFNGEFPKTHKEILSLKGIGPYTAAAIASICFHLPHAVVDGNVYRVLSRYYNIDSPINSTQGKKDFEKLANQLILHENPGDYNQAIMEFGAKQCKPQQPNCSICPLNQSCLALKKSRITELPIKLKKIKVKTRFLHFFLLTDEKNLLVEKRDNLNIWKGLYQLPLIELEEPKEIHEVLQLSEFQKLVTNEPFELISHQEIKHKLTHRNLEIRFYHLKTFSLKNKGFQKIAKDKWEEYAFPKPITDYLNQMD